MLKKFFTILEWFALKNLFYSIAFLLKTSLKMSEIFFTFIHLFFKKKKGWERVECDLFYFLNATVSLIKSVCLALLHSKLYAEWINKWMNWIELDKIFFITNKFQAVMVSINVLDMNLILSVELCVASPTVLAEICVVSPTVVRHHALGS